jgi:WD40 repeat protein
VDGNIMVWSLPDGQPVGRVDGLSGEVAFLALSHADTFLASAGKDRVVALWTLPLTQGRQTANKKLDMPFSAAALSSDDKLAAIACSRTIRLWRLPQCELLVQLMDITASPHDAKGIQYTYKDVYGSEHTFELPCGSPIPSGAICVCNCVPGSWTSPTGNQYGSSETCSCDMVCTCDTICTCLGVCSCVGNAPTSTYSYHYWYPN